jgi:AbrB family looped-hinge helix DNA binding protein
MKTNLCTLTERGQISVPAVIRKDLGLHPGQRLRWEKVSSSECRIVIERENAQGPMAALGFARKFRQGKARRTSEWMRELREGE